MRHSEFSHVAPRGIGEGEGMLYLVARHPRSDVRCASPPSSSTLLPLSFSLSLSSTPWKKSKFPVDSLDCRPAALRNWKWMPARSRLRSLAV